MPDNPQQHYNNILECLSAVRRRALWLELGAATLIGLLALLVLGTVWLCAEAFFYLTPGWRIGTGLAALMGAVAAAAFYLRQRLPERLSLHRLGHHLESNLPELRERLTSTLELWPDQRAHQLYSPALLQAMLAETAQALHHLAPHRLFTAAMLKPHARRLGLGVAAVLAVYSVFSPSLEAAFHRCSHPLTHFAQQARTGIAIEPGDMEVIKGEDAVVKVRFSGVIPRTARIQRRPADDAAWDQEDLVIERADSLVYAFKQVKQPFTYQVLANDGKSPLYRIGVIDPPRLQRLELRYQYPAYSGLPDRIDTKNGDISALAGTRITFTADANKTLASAALVLDDSLQLPARVEDRRVYAALTLENPGRYHIALQDRKGITNRAPIRYAIHVVDDTPPQVAIAAPGRDIDLPDDRQVLLIIEANDDFGIAALTLFYRVNDGPWQQRMLKTPAGRLLNLDHIWNLEGIDLLPEDRVHYYVEALDNDTISGPKVGRSREYVLRFPSLHELYNEVSQTQQQDLAQLEELAMAEENTGEYLEKLRRELVKTEELSWEQQKELETTLAQEAERLEQMEELAQQLDKTIGQMEESGLASEELLDKLEEIRELMADVAIPELQEALAKLQESVESQDPKDIAEALREFTEDQTAFQERLDRTIELLRQIQAEQRLEAAAQQAEDMAKRQGQINEGLQRDEDAERLANQETALQRDTERLQQALAALAQTMQQISPQTAATLAALASQMGEQELAERMQEMSGQMQQGQTRQAAPNGESLKGDLQRLSANLQQAQQDFVQEQKEELAEHMKDAMHNLLYLSHRQEAMWEDNLAKRSPPQNMAHHQFALLQGTFQVAEELASIGERTLNLEESLGVTLGYVINNMQQAAHYLGQRDGRRGIAPQQAAMGYLNEAVNLMRQSLDNLDQSQMPSGYAEAMQRMAGMAEQQGGLNEATQQSMQPGQKQGPNGQPGGMARRLAAEQQRLHDALSQLEQGLRGHRGAQERVAAIQEEMRSVIKALQSRRLQADTVKRQRRIHQQLLDASRSIHTQGQKKERQATSGQDQQYVGPDQLPADLGQARDALRQAMQRALEGPYPESYLELIRQYYELVYQDLIDQENAP
jgi:hypothetical protein